LKTKDLSVITLKLTDFGLSRVFDKTYSSVQPVNNIFAHPLL
jgi:hypothetical protein